MTPRAFVALLFAASTESVKVRPGRDKREDLHARTLNQTPNQRNRTRETDGKSIPRSETRPNVGPRTINDGGTANNKIRERRGVRIGIRV